MSQAQTRQTQSQDILLGNPSGLKILKYLGEIVILTTSIVNVVLYRTSFDLGIELFQQFLTWIVLECIILCLNTYHFTIWYRNVDMSFTSYDELNEWYNQKFYKKLEMILYLVSLIIRFTFIQLLWKPPAEFNGQQLQLYTMIYIVSVWSYAQVLAVLYSIGGCLCSGAQLRRGVNRTIANNRFIRTITTYSIRTTTTTTDFIANNSSTTPPDADNCSICLETEGDAWVQLVCNHKFHRSCMHKYIITAIYQPVCPMCRGPIIQISPAQTQPIEISIA